MNKTKAIIFTLLIAGFVSNSNAQIPVTDVASISSQVAHHVESIAKWVQQFNQMKEQIYQYDRQFKAIMGARNIGTLLDNPNIRSALPSDWQSILDNVKSTSSFKAERAAFPTLTGMPKTNELFDLMASNNAVISDLYKKSNARITQIQNLMGQIDSANDPAAKADLANRLINEQNTIQANQNLVVLLQQKQQQQLEVAKRNAIKEFSCKEFKNC